MSSKLIENAGYSTGVFGYAPHTHNCYEIIYLREGHLHLQVNQRHYEATGPALILLSKLESHSLQVIGSVYERYYLCISPVSAGDLIRDYTLLSLLSNRPETFRHVLDIRSFSEEADRIFAACVREFEQELPYAAQRQAALLTELLVLVYRQTPLLFGGENDKSISVVWKIQCRFEQEYGEKFTLHSLAEEYHMSVSYLSHLFKRLTGYSIMEYLAMCRLSVAKKLLSETDLPVTKIVFSTGFTDSSNFSRVFRREIGCTPLEYRKKEKEFFQ